MGNEQTSPGSAEELALRRRIQRPRAAPPSRVEPKEPVRVFLSLNVLLWCVLFAAWTPYAAMAGLTDPVSVQVGCILGITAVLTALQGITRWRRHRRVRVSA